MKQNALVTTQCDQQNVFEARAIIMYIFDTKLF